MNQQTKIKKDYPTTGFLYDRSIYDDAVMSGIIHDNDGLILSLWQKEPHLDIDTIAKKPVRFLLCAAGFREWRDTMLWRRAYEEGQLYSTSDPITLSEMSDDSLYDVFFYYAGLLDSFAETPWGYHFQEEINLREGGY